MSWSDEATIWMSSSAINIPAHITTNGRIEGCFGAVSVMGSLPTRIDTDGGGEARPQHRELGIAGIEQDAHRHALHDLCEISGGILGRDHAEDRASARRETHHMSVEDMVGQHVRRHGRGLA